MVRCAEFGVAVVALVVFALFHNAVDAAQHLAIVHLIGHLKFVIRHINVAAQLREREVLFVRVFDVDVNFFHSGIAFVYFIA